MTAIKTNKTSVNLAWASLVCGVLSWALMQKPIVGFDIAAIVLGILALKLASNDEKLIRRIAWLGLCIGAAKLIVVIFSFIALLLAFWKNPVAH